MKLVRDRIRNKILKEQDDDAGSAAATATVTQPENGSERRRRKAAEENPEQPFVPLFEKLEPASPQP